MKTSTQQIYKILSEAATQYYDAKFFKQKIPLKTECAYVIARERAARQEGVEFVRHVDEQSKNLFNFLDK